MSENYIDHRGNKTLAAAEADRVRRAQRGFEIRLLTRPGVTQASIDRNNQPVDEEMQARALAIPSQEERDAQVAEAVRAQGQVPAGSVRRSASEKVMDGEWRCGGCRQAGTGVIPPTHTQGRCRWRALWTAVRSDKGRDHRDVIDRAMALVAGRLAKASIDAAIATLDAALAAREGNI